MSSQEEQSLMVQAASDDFCFDIVDIAAFVLLAYDTLLTFPSEVKYIWPKKIQLGTTLYLLARYPGLFQLLLQIYFNFATFPSNQGLQCSIIFHQYSSVTSHNWSPRPFVGKSIHHI
ncbi:hypothetical protein K439DRAFT_591861 [Ramaria rubella]|nr:hypothetical protein K439DRAFT_591861 [Ramaria rubella]